MAESLLEWKNTMNREPCARRVQSRARRTLLGALSALALLVAASTARAGDGPTAAREASPTAADEAAWRRRYEEARARLVDGDHAGAEAEARALAAAAPPGSVERALALDLASLAVDVAARARRPSPPRRPPAPAPALDPRLRTTDELTLLYATSFLYGAGTGAWFLLQTEPDSALTATLPFAALTAAPVLAVATVDGYRRFRRGVPHAMSAGAYLGLGQGVWLLGFQHARASRIERADERADVRWSAEAGSTALWTGATLGATLGYALGSSLETTPGRVSFTVSTSAWSAALTGLTFAALLPDDDLRGERAFAATGIGYNAGLVGGLLGAGAVSPSVARVRLVDLLGIAGGLATSGFYLSVSDDADARTAEGLAAAGIAVGLASGWIATSSMPKELPSSEPAPRVVVNPSILPVRGGATVGVAGAL